MTQLSGLIAAASTPLRHGAIDIDRVRLVAHDRRLLALGPVESDWCSCMAHGHACLPRPCDEARRKLETHLQHQTEYRIRSDAVAF